MGHTSTRRSSLTSSRPFWGGPRHTESFRPLLIRSSIAAHAHLYLRLTKSLEPYRADYFRQRPTEDIEKQSKGMSEKEYVEPVVQRQIPERARLAELICTFPKDLAPQDIVNRRITVIDLMTALCYKREVPRRYQRQVTPLQELNLKQESPDPSPFPIVCKKTQCPFCIGDESKRVTSFAVL